MNYPGYWQSRCRAANRCVASWPSRPALSLVHLDWGLPGQPGRTAAAPTAAVVPARRIGINAWQLAGPVMATRVVSVERVEPTLVAPRRPHAATGHAPL